MFENELSFFFNNHFIYNISVNCKLKIIKKVIKILETPFKIK